MRHGRGADAALGADHRDDAADRLGVGRGKQAADRAHDVERADRRDQVVADAAAHQLAIEQHVVVPADHDHAGAGIADFGERIEAGQDVLGARFEFQHDDVRRRRRAIGFGRRRHAAHLDFQMRLAEPAVFAGRLHGGRGFHGFAEGLDRDPRRRRDMLVARRQIGRFGGSVAGCSAFLIICRRRSACLWSDSE